MTGHDDFDRTLAGWFEADALSPAPAGDLDRVLDLTRRRRPRSGWLAGLGSQWVGGAPDAGSRSGVRSLERLELRWSRTVLLLLVIAVLVGGAIVVGATLFQPPLLPTVRLGHLAYGLDGDIYVADWDGRNPVRIADGASEDGAASCGSFGIEGPMWSPDGRYLAYRGCGTVFISDPAGHVVASFPGSGWRVSWSPDSTRVATWIEPEQTIGVYGLDGVRQALLTLPPGLLPPGDFDPTWSPDGASLLISLAPLPPTQLAGQVWELPVDGRTPRPLPADDPRSNWKASFSRDGARVVFNKDQHLVVAAADGTQQRLLAEGANPPPEESIVWSPTGDRVAFTWSVDRVGSGSSLRVIDVTSGKVWELGSGGQMAALSFSPEGDRILFWQTDHDGVPSLRSVNADGSDSRRLVTGTAAGDWQWQPAGQ